MEQLDDNGWTWAKGPRPPPSENGRSKQVRSENLLSRSVLLSFAYRLRNSQRSAPADSIRGGKGRTDHDFKTGYTVKNQVSPVLY
jgi:hypothetical protein